MRSLMRSSGHFRGTEGRWQLFGCCSGSRRGRCNSSVFGSWSAPCSRARPCARGQLSFVLNRHLSVSQQPLPSLRSRSQEAQMRCSCLDAAESFLGHGTWRSLMGLLTKLISSLMDRSLSSVRQRVEQSHFSRKSRRGAKRRSSHGRQVLYTRFCGTFFDGRSTLLPVLKATPFRGLLVQTRRCPRVIRGVFSFRGADFVPVSQRAHDSQKSKRVRTSRARRPLSEMWRAPRRTRPCFCSVWRAVVLFCVATAGWLARDMSNDQALRVV